MTEERAGRREGAEGAAAPARRLRTLVTGGSGFIGSHLVERLLERGRAVTVVDDLSTGRATNLDDARRLAADRGGDLRIVEGTVGDVLPSLDPADYDEVFHLAAAVGVRLVVEQPVETIETNVFETGVLLRFAARAQARVLVASSSEVYGKSARLPFREDDDVVYGPTTLHRWSYAMTKAIDEYLALAWHREHGLPVVIARFFNTVGPRQIGTYGMVLPRFVARALANRPLEVHGDGRQTRCFCDVRDVVEVVADLPANEALAGRVVNVGHDEPISIAELARLVVGTLGSDSEIVAVPYEQAFGTGFDDLRDRVPALDRLRDATGFRPRHDLESTIHDVAAGLRAATARDAAGGRTAGHAAGEAPS